MAGGGGGRKKQSGSTEEPMGKNKTTRGGGRTIRAGVDKKIVSLLVPPSVTGSLVEFFLFHLLRLFLSNLLF
jgi:hypothetical protein